MQLIPDDEEIQNQREGGVKIGRFNTVFLDKDQRAGSGIEHDEIESPGTVKKDDMLGLLGPGEEPKESMPVIAC